MLNRTLAGFLFALAALADLMPAGSAAQTSPNMATVAVTNDTSTGTTVNKLAKLTSSAKAIIAAITDTDGLIGVVQSGAGLSGIAQIVTDGNALCAFDGTATAGDWVSISTTTAGDCHDAGATRPTTFNQVIGRVLVGGTGAGNYTVNFVMIPATQSLGPVTMSLGSDATGDIYYRNSGGVLTRLPIGTNGFALTVVTGLPSWQPVTASTVTPGTTTVTSGNNGYALTNNGGTLANTQLFSSAAGLINKFRNPGFDVFNRGGQTISSSGSYGPDGWKINFAGSANVSISQGGQFNVGLSGHNLTISGATSNTDVSIAQRIESFVAAPLAGQTVTFSILWFQDTGSTQTPKLSTCFASATDNFTTCTADLAATSLQSCATSTLCSASYTFTASSSAANGYQVTFDCNAAFGAAAHCEMTNADIRVTPGVATGLNSNPPTAELRNVGFEAMFAARYFRALKNDSTAFIWTVNALADVAGAGVDYVFRFDDVPMRAAPTLTTDGTAGDYSLAAGDGSSSTACTSVPTLIFSSTGHAFIRFNKTSLALTTNTVARIFGTNSSAFLWLSAEL